MKNTATETVNAGRHFTFPEHVRRGFFLLPEELVGMPDSSGGYTSALWSRLTQSAQAVLIAVASHVDNKGAAFPSEERIAGLTGLTRKTVRRALQELEHAEIIKIHRYISRSGRRAKRFEWLLRRNGEGTLRFYHSMLDHGIWRVFIPSAKSLYAAFRFFGRARPDLDPDFDATDRNYGSFLGANSGDGGGEEWQEYLQERTVDFCNAEPAILCDFAGITRRSFNDGIKSLGKIDAVKPFNDEYWQVSILPPRCWKVDWLNRQLKEAGGVK